MVALQLIIYRLPASENLTWYFLINRQNVTQYDKVKRYFYDLYRLTLINQVSPLTEKTENLLTQPWTEYLDCRSCTTELWAPVCVYSIHEMCFSTHKTENFMTHANQPLWVELGSLRHRQGIDHDCWNWTILWYDRRRPLNSCETSRFWFGSLQLPTRTFFSFSTVPFGLEQYGNHKLSLNVWM